MIQNRKDNGDKKFSPKWWKILIKILLPFIIIGVSLIVAKRIYDTRPIAHKQEIIKIKPKVDIDLIKKSNQRVIVRCMGTIVPSQEIILKSKVAGEVIEINPEFIIGGHLKSGDRILKIDDTDYRLLQIQKQEQLKIAEADLKMEMGRASIAKDEWEMLNLQKDINEVDMELALRKPQLEQKKSALRLAKASLDIANINLNRTSIHAPFNCVVLLKNIDIGSQVSVQDQIATLVSTDEFWVQVSIPYDRLKWITIPDKEEPTGSKVKIIYGNNTAPFTANGTVKKLLADVEKDGRMARLLVSVKDPLILNSIKSDHHPLLLGDYVQVEIEGMELSNIFKIPRFALRDNDYVWIATDNKKLNILKVDVIWRDRYSVYITDGIREDQQLIITDLPAPVEGMELLVDSNSKDALIK